MAFFWGCNGTASSGKVITERGDALGTTYTIIYEPGDKITGVKAGIKTVFEEVNRSMSTYLPESDISRINRGDSTVITDEYFRTVFLQAKEVWRHTGGKFDPTVGALVNAWGFGPEETLKKVSPQEVDSILVFTGFDKVSLSGEGRVIKNHGLVYLDFNALAKGYTIDLIGRLFDEKGIGNYLIEIGGEILTKGRNPQTEKPWRIAIDHPQQDDERTLIIRLNLTDKAIATSGNYRKFKTDAETGEQYAHIIDPETGYPKKSKILSVSVIAGTCMEADAYATAFMVMDLEASRKLLPQLPDLDVYIIYTGENGELATYSTAGFRKLIIE